MMEIDYEMVDDEVLAGTCSRQVIEESCLAESIPPVLSADRTEICRELRQLVG
jgi:hypothetical protein